MNFETEFTNACACKVTDFMGGDDNAAPLIFVY